MIARIAQDRRWHLLFATAVFVALVYTFRFQWLEDQARGLACEGSSSVLCLFRQGVIDLFWHQVFGWTALVLSLLALAWPLRITLIPALAMTAIALVLYDVDTGSLAAMITLVSLARMGHHP